MTEHTPPTYDQSQPPKHDLPETADDQPLKLTPQQRRQRHIMLDRVEQSWIKGVLDRSLHYEVWLELGLKGQPDTLTDLGQMSWYGTDSTANLADLVTAADQNLLILGEAGLGKTTLLLALAQARIVQAKADEAQPLPLVFNLAAWSDPRQLLADWFVEQLSRLYRIPKRVGVAWIETDALLFLLDGLDHVADEHRLACLAAIEAFRQHYNSPIVVCSEMGEAETLRSQLKLDRAVQIAPLTPPQITTHLVSLGLDPEPIRQAMQRDPLKQQLLASPLMLNIALLTDQAAVFTSSPTSITLPAYRTHMIEAYVARMLAQPERESNYTQPQMRPRLSWLARQMIAHQQPVFLLELLQPTWLATETQRWSLRLLTGLGLGLLLGLLTILLISPLSGLLVGLVAAISIGLQGPITPVEVVSWSRQKAMSGLKKEVGLTLLAGVMVGGLIGWSSGLGAGLSAGLSVGLIFWLVGGLDTEVVLQTNEPNQSIWLSGQNGLVFGAIFGLIVGVIGGLNVGLIGGLIFGLIGGDLAFLRHATLRRLLASTDQLPFALIPFLDEATERGLLRRVGGGYIFIHRRVQDYFAEIR